MNRRGFTLVELAVCMTLLAILAPLLYSYALGIEDRFAAGRWHLQAADQLHTVADRLQADARRGALMESAVQFRHEECVVDYRLEDNALVRASSCDGTQTLARGVTALARKANGAEVTFTHRLRQDRALSRSFFIVLE